jgi:hypothetical protein
LRLCPSVSNFEYFYNRTCTVSAIPIEPESIAKSSILEIRAADKICNFRLRSRFGNPNLIQATDSSRRIEI